MELRSTRGRGRRALAAILIAVGLVGAGALTATTATADTKGGSAGFGNDVYVYANAGEQLVLTQVGAAEVRAPDGTALTADSCVGAVCTYTSPGTGVLWLKGAYAGANTAWDISVRSGGTPISGRVWADSWTFGTANFRYEDFTVYYLSPYGVLYSGAYTRFMGWAYEIWANSVGLTVGDTCLPSYQSARYADVIDGPSPGASADLTLSTAACGDVAVDYRVFLDRPDPSMPASATAWGDGRTADRWVNPPYTTPQITGTAFARANASGSAGTITGSLAGQPGRVTAQIDTNGNGVFTDPQDVTLGEVPAGIGPFSIPWDGKDGQGNAVSPLKELTIRLSYDGQAEIHFLARDVEGLSGLVLTRLTGPGAPDTTVSWDDTRPAATTTYPLTAPVTATDVDSATTAHSWAFTPGVPLSLGDESYIDTWASIPLTDVLVHSDLVVPALAQSLSITKSADAPASGVYRGDTVAYTVSVTNDGTADYTEQNPGTIQDDLSGVLDDAEQTGSLSASQGAASVVGSTLTWTLTDLPVGETATLTYSFHVDASARAGADDDLVNRAYVGASAPQGCPAGTCAQVDVPVLTRSSGGGSTVTPTPAASAPVASATPVARGALAHTGSSPLPIVAAAVLAIVAGAVFLAARRRRTA